MRGVQNSMGEGDQIGETLSYAMGESLCGEVSKIEKIGLFGPHTIRDGRVGTWFTMHTV